MHPNGNEMENGTVTVGSDVRVSVIVQDRSRLFGESLGLLMESAHAIRAVCVATPVELAESIGRDDVVAVILEASGTPWDVEDLIPRVRSAIPSVRIVGTYPSGPVRHRQIHDVTLVSRGASSQAFCAAALGKDVDSSEGIQGPYEVAPRHAEALTRREFQVLALISSGLTTAQIADRLGISAKTVEGKRQTLYSKLGVQNQSAAVAVAIKAGLLRAGPAEPASTST
jgi:DNA-binding CsgD family transcriptional regulator